MTIDEKEILKRLSEQPQTVRELAAALGMGPAERPFLRRIVRRLVQSGDLVEMRGRRFGAKSALGDVVGRFARHRAGFGFVNPDDGSDDLFIRIGAQGSALHGDVVAAREIARRADGKREGRIVRVVERASSRVSGVFYETASGGGIVEPLDKGFGFEIVVRRGDTAEAKSGEIVGVGLDVFPDEQHAAKGRVVERLGRPDEPGVDVEVLIRKYGFPLAFPDEALAEADALPTDPKAWPREGREDFTGDDVVTIDGESAKDFDDAICVQRRPGGGFRLHVHIADVAHFVAEDGALDREALRRGTSVYFPGRCLPMLPEQLSNGLCSLRPDEPRLTQGTTIDYDEAGAVVAARFHRGIIRSKARLTYTEVARIVEERDPAARAFRPGLLPMLDAAAELAGLLADRRRARGAVDFDLPEPQILLDLTGATTDIVSRPRNLAHRMVEEFMLAANEAVADLLVRAEVPTLYRAHERPDPPRVERAALALDALGYALPAPYTAIEPRHFAEVVERAKGRPEEPFVVRLALRAMALARYGDECLGHFGLALRRYLHFTSPIRRYPDLVAHRSLRRLLEKTPETPGEREDRAARMPELARECSRLEREAESAEREAVAWKIASFMADRLGDEFKGRIVEVAAYGVMVALAEPAVEGLLHVSRLGDEEFRFDPKKLVLRGAETGRVFRLGMEIDVRVDRVDALAHMVDFAPVTPTIAVAPRGARRGGRKAAARKTGGEGRGRGAKGAAEARAGKERAAAKKAPAAKKGPAAAKTGPGAAKPGPGAAKTGTGAAKKGAGRPGRHRPRGGR